ncbi:MAG TPA: aquaporin [Thermoplasmata archaeon]|nr:aquaporin [Thermoplasmata archaeon]
MSRRLVHRCLAEVAGTALLVGIGTGTIVAAGEAGGIPQWMMASAWFLAVLIPIVLFVHVSGAHLNPAVTLALASSGRITWKEAPPYWASQFLGAFLASSSVLLLLGGGSYLGATLPANGNIPRTFVAEGAFSALLVITVFVLADRGEGRRRWRILLPPSAVGVSTYLIGPWTGSSLNPARSVAPAVLSGTYVDLWIYLIAVPLAALAVAVLWKPRSVDLADRGPGRLEVTR